MRAFPGAGGPPPRRRGRPMPHQRAGPSSPRTYPELLAVEETVGFGDHPVVTTGAAYESARRGELRALRFGRRLVVTTATIERMLAPPQDDAEPNRSSRGVRR